MQCLYPVRGRLRRGIDPRLLLTLVCSCLALTLFLASFLLGVGGMTALSVSRVLCYSAARMVCGNSGSTTSLRGVLHGSVLQVQWSCWSWLRLVWRAIRSLGGPRQNAREFGEALDDHMWIV
jgi:hypothetical protein